MNPDDYIGKVVVVAGFGMFLVLATGRTAPRMLLIKGLLPNGQIQFCFATPEDIEVKEVP